jgi:hypothetical protein
MAAEPSPPDPDEAGRPADAAQGERRGEAALALRNALKLASSLVLTWGVALIVAFKLPKYLGPTPYGVYQMGESATGNAKSADP